MASNRADDLAWKKAIAFVNAEFDEDVGTLSKSNAILTQISNNKEILEKRVSFAVTEGPSVLEKAVRDAKEASQRIGQLPEEQELLCGDIAYHNADVSSLAKKLSTLTNQLKEVDRYANYLKVISRIEDFSSDVQSALLINSVDRAVAQFFELAEFVESLQSSRCRNLITFANESVLFWYKILKEKFAAEFADVLAAWRWPFILSTTKTTTKPPQNAAELRERLCPLFVNLLRLQLPDGLSHLQPASNSFLQSLPGWKTPLLPIQLMIKPLSKRFRFHFYGSKQTNSLDKPEWYLSQTLTWIRDHREFLRTHIQPVLEQEGLGYLDAVVEFSRGLVILVTEKILTDVPELLFDDHSFSHLVDEVLLYDGELRQTYAYPPSALGCLTVLTQDRPFRKWVNIEKKFAQEKMDQIFSSPSAWQSQYKDISDVDDLKVPECGESFMTLMHTITERYKPLPTPVHRVAFLDLELDMLEDFRYRLTQIKTDASQDPLGQCYCAVLNTVNYVSEIIADWSELVFFIQLQYFKTLQSQSFDGTKGDSLPGENTTSSLETSTNLADSMVSFESVDETKMCSLEGSVFDEIIDLLARMKNEMVQCIVSYVTDDVKARTRPYRNDKWVGMPPPKEVVSPALSSTACEMMLVLREHLQHLEQALSRPIFTLVWQKLATILNSYLYQELILANKFSEGGASQLQFDMTRNLFPLFGQYTQKPDAYFKDIKEACLVLSLPVGSALLLKDVLYRSLHDPHSDPRDKPADPVAVLHEQGVYKLCAEEVELLLRLRTNLVTG